MTIREIPPEVLTFRDTLDELGRVTTELAGTVRGMKVNDVLDQGQVFIPGALGWVTKTYPVNFAAIAVANDSTHSMFMSADELDDRRVGNQNNLQGQGGFFIPAGHGRIWPMTGNVWTLYGQGGDYFTIAVFLTAQSPAGW